MFFLKTQREPTLLQFAPMASNGHLREARFLSLLLTEAEFHEWWHSSGYGVQGRTCLRDKLIFGVV